MKNTIHDLTMLYLEKHYKPGNDAPSDMVEEYCRVKEEVRKAIVKYYQETGKCL